jgi:hypothetical protein
MFGQKARLDSREESDPAPGGRRREGRGLGPFTSGHLTIIVVTLLVLVGFPFAAFAVTGNNVFVTDPVSGARAHVNSSGQQLVSGPVTATVAYPTGAIVHTDNGSSANMVLATECAGTTCNTLLRPPAGQAAVVTTIHIDTYLATVTGKALVIYRSGDGTCNYATLDRVIEVFTPAGIGETVLPYDMPGGLPVPAGKALCVRNTDPSNLAFDVGAYGYAVASGTVPANAPAAGAPTGAALLQLAHPR